MAAGVITLSTARKVQVESNSCFDAILALYNLRTLNQTGGTCSADPVIAGSTVTMTYSTAPTSVVYTVSTTTASAREAADLGNKAADWATVPFLLQAVLVVAAVYMVFNGFSAGNKL